MSSHQTPRICPYRGTPLRKGIKKTREHVIPQSLFTALPANVWTVKVCEKCNNEKSGTDDYLRDMLVSQDACQWHPVAKDLFPKVKRSAGYNTSRFARTAVPQAKPTPIYSPEGVYLRTLYGMPLEGEVLQKIFTWLTRGLYYHLFRQRIPDGYVFDGAQLDASVIPEIWEEFHKLNGHNPLVLGRGVFGCDVMRLDSDPFTTYWLLGFYQWMMIADLGESPPKVFLPSQFDKGVTIVMHTYLPGTPGALEDDSDAANTHQ